MAQPPLPLDRADPKGLVRESYAIAGITAAECRSIFVDWALSLPPGVAEEAAMRALLAAHGAAADHPMTALLRDGLGAPAPPPGRRGGRSGGRRTGPGPEDGTPQQPSDRPASDPARRR